ncbi:hypothetical protein [Selenomonas sputigena]|uniref:hypothetical protein n=1 Tax=Selenomonas sputigena TaxID=69823 RepID=UPI0022344AA0|nr:hypothetical protein [Selenomonas sputigena]UZE46060.1 hypothetical protein OL236_03830 [Selenomonas sputigena]
MIRSYENLANAVIEQAVKDYRRARVKLAKEAGDVMALKMRRETERFFRSAWFGQLTALDGELLLEKLEEESE